MLLPYFSHRASATSSFIALQSTSNEIIHHHQGHPLWAWKRLAYIISLWVGGKKFHSENIADWFVLHGSLEKLSSSFRGCRIVTAVYMHPWADLVLSVSSVYRETVELASKKRQAKVKKVKQRNQEALIPSEKILQWSRLSWESASRWKKKKKRESIRELGKF